MAFARVSMRTRDGRTYGPVALDEFKQWLREGRVPDDAVLIDADTGAERAVRDLPELAPPAGAVPPPPPPMAGTPYAQPEPPSVTTVWTTNNPANLAMILGLISLFTCGLVGPFAIYYGMTGLREAEHTGVGKVAAIIGLVTGIVATLGVIVVLLGFSVFPSFPRMHPGGPFSPFSRPF
jgi:hypothetical protein